MNTIIMFVAKMWALVVQWKYVAVATQAARNSLTCGYDSETQQSRINETMGLAMLTEWIEYEYATLKAQGFKTDWQDAKIRVMCAMGGSLLTQAGWTQERATRIIMKIDANAQDQVQ